MGAFATLDIYSSTYSDLDQGIIVLLGGATVAALASCPSATLTVRATPVDASPLVQIVQQNPGAGGGLITFGVGCPSPVGLNATNIAELTADFDGPPVVQTGAPGPTVLTAATTTALAAAPTSSYTVGQLAFVQQGSGSYFAWSPADPNLPNGTTIIAGASGNWLYAHTVRLLIPAATLAPLLGTAQAQWDLFVTWPSGGTCKLLSGVWYVDQSVGA